MTSYLDLTLSSVVFAQIDRLAGRSKTCRFSSVSMAVWTQVVNPGLASTAL